MKKLKELNKWIDENPEEFEKEIEDIVKKVDKRKSMIDKNKLIKNSIFSKFFWISLLWKQNKWHRHGVLIHTLRVAFYTIKAKEYKMIAAAFLHDIGKPYVAFQKGEDIETGEYSFTDHEEASYQIIKDWKFISNYTKNLVRYHYLIRDISKSKKKDLPRFYEKSGIWDSLEEEMQEDLKRFIIYDDLAKS